MNTVENSSGVAVAARRSTGVLIGQVNILWGVQPEIRPIKNAPPGTQRIRMRNKELVRLFVKNEEGIREFVLVKDGTDWAVDYRLERARNHRPIRNPQSALRN